MASTTGTVVHLTIESQALGGLRQVPVYLPPGYGAGEARYPVVYLFRGHEREWLNPAEDQHRQGRTAATIADELIGSGAIPPLILVMPGLTSADERVPGLGINLKAPERAGAAAGIGPGRFADFLVQEVIPAVDARFSTRRDRQGRGVDGFSLGGFTALSLALRFPHLFASAGAFDGTFFYAGGRRPDGSPDALLYHPMLAPVFGDPVDLELVARTNPADLIDRLPDDVLGAIAFHIHCAPEEQEPHASNYYRNQYLIAKLRSRGARLTCDPFVLPGSSHNWYWADEHLRLSLIQHAAIFTARAGADHEVRGIPAPRTY
jgi:S-formylglutathione hydrolase FrmB